MARTIKAVAQATCIADWHALCRVRGRRAAEQASASSREAGTQQATPGVAERRASHCTCGPHRTPILSALYDLPRVR